MGRVSSNRRKELETLEHTLHDRLAEITRRLTSVRATLQIYEDALQKTLGELTQVRAEIEELDKQLEANWNRTGYIKESKQGPET
jgi:chromosome segregation ATPase